MFNTLIRLIAFPALCLIVAFGGVSHAQEGGEVSGIIAPEAEDSDAVVVPEGAIEWGAFGTDTQSMQWTVTPILISGSRGMVPDIKVRDGEACARAAAGWLAIRDITYVQVVVCTSFDGEVKTYE